MSCEAFLDRDDWQALACYMNHTLSPPRQPPTLKQAALWIAKLKLYSSLAHHPGGDPHCKNPILPYSDDGNAASPVGRRLYPWWRRWRRWRYQVILNRLALRLGPVRLRRDIGALQRLLVSSGRAAWLGQPFPPGPPPPPPEDLPRAVARVWALFDW